MITIITELQGNSAIAPLYCGVSSIVPTTGFAIPGLSPGMNTAFPTRVHSWESFISTGKAQAFGDRPCDNFQISGTVHVPSVVTGDVSAYNPSNGIVAGQDVSPHSSLGYSFEELRDAWGTETISSLHRYKHRDVNPGVALNANPAYIFSTATSGEGRAYAARNGFNTQSLFIAQEAAFAFRTYYAGPGRVALFGVNAYLQTVWDATGTSVGYGGSASASFTVLGPSAPGSSDCVNWTPSPSGIWAPTFGNLDLPPFLQTLTRSSFDAILANPSVLVSWTPPGVPTLQSVPTWSDFSHVPGQFWKGTVSSIPPPLDSIEDEAQTAVSIYFRPIVRQLSAPSGVDDWQELGDRAADNLLQTSVNHYANATQLSKTLDSFRATLMLAKNWQSPQAWAKWWLSFRYGDRLTIKDLSEDMNAVQSEFLVRTAGWVRDFNTSHSQSHTTVTCSQGRIPPARVDHYLKLYYKFADYGWFGKAYVFGRKWSLWPTGEAAWDIIPFSFVVDWFVDVGGLWAEFDRDTFLQYVDVLSVLTTEKKTYDFGDIALTSGYRMSDAKVTYYSRSLGTRLPSGPFRIDRGHASSINVVDGISLVIQAI